MDSHCEDGDYSCDTCLFQCNKIWLLKHHLVHSPSHSSGQVCGRATQKCNICEDKFITKNDLMNHINLVHPSYKPCRDYQKQICKRTKCRYKHQILKEGYSVCFQCGKEFSDKSFMKKHIKTAHSSATCIKFLKNECDRQDGTEDECWFTHVLDVEKPTSSVTTHKTYASKVQGFQKSPSNLVSHTQYLNQESLIKSMEEKIMNSVSKIMEQFMEKIKKNF